MSVNYVGKAELTYFAAAEKTKMDAHYVQQEEGKGLSANDLTSALKTNYDAAYTHSTSTHARTDATKTEASTTNGKIKINGSDVTVYTHPTVTGATTTNPHGTTKSDVGLGNVGNFKAVSTVASQGLTDTEKSNARANIGAGTSSFSGNYNDLTNKPTIPSGVIVDSSMSDSSTNAIQNKVVKKYIDDKTSSVYRPKGSITFANLPTSGMAIGDVYNISNAFTTTTAFEEGSGKSYPAGTNVVYDSNSKWDVLSGIVDLSGYMKTTDLVALTTAEIDTIVAGVWG